MADISAEIAAFKQAVYGEDVRNAMVSLANKLNDIVTNCIESGPLTYRGALPNNTNLNNVDGMTTYFLMSGYSYTNAPSDFSFATWSCLITYGNPTTKHNALYHQYIFQISSNGNFKIYGRYSSNAESSSSWGNWSLISNIEYESVKDRIATFYPNDNGVLGYSRIVDIDKFCVTIDPPLNGFSDSPIQNVHRGIVFHIPYTTQIVTIPYWLDIYIYYATEYEKQIYMRIARPGNNQTIDSYIPWSLISGGSSKSNLYGKTIVGLGDSFIDYHTQGSGKDLLSKIAYGKSMTIYNYGLSSSSLAYDPNQTVLSVMDRYQTMISQVSNADVVIVLAGHNDSNPSLHSGTAIPIGNNSDNINTTFKGALNILINALLTAYPASKLLFLTPFNRRGTEEPYVDAMKEICALYSVPCFDNYRESGVCFQNNAQRSLYDLSNSLHLNEAGNVRMANKYVPILENM